MRELKTEEMRDVSGGFLILLAILMPGEVTDDGTGYYDNEHNVPFCA